jgi:hypothetical protein
LTAAIRLAKNLLALGLNVCQRNQLVQPVTHREMAEALHAQKSNQYPVGVRAARTSPFLSAQLSQSQIFVLVWQSLTLAKALSGDLQTVSIEGDCLVDSSLAKGYSHRHIQSLAVQRKHCTARSKQPLTMGFTMISMDPWE